MSGNASGPSHPPRHEGALSDTRGRLLATLPVSRVSALLRGLMWMAGAVTLWLVTWAICNALFSGPAGATSKIVNISMALISLPLPIAAVWLTVKAVRWSALGLWLGRIEIAAYENLLILRFGSFGTWRLDTDRVEVRYPFELDSEDGGFEQFLPEEEQMATLLPRVTHPEVAEPVNRLIIRLAGSDERSITTILRPAFDHWRGEAP